MAEKAEIIQLLEIHGEDEWFSGGKGSPRTVEKLEHKLNVNLPEDYRQLLAFSNGGSIIGSHSAIHLEDVEGVILQSTDPWYMQNLPGMVIIGDDGGGKVYFLDPLNRLEHGRDCVYLVPMSSIGVEGAVKVGDNLLDAVRRLYGGENFSRLIFPPIGSEEE